MLIKEWIRKQVVYLKRNTRIITLLLIIASCFAFTFLMSAHSQAIFRLSFDGGALTFFIIVLASFMSIFSFVSFKRFNKKGIVPLCITLFLLILQLVLDSIFLYYLKSDLKAAAGTYASYLLKSQNWIIVHIVFLCVTLLSVPMLPLVSKLLGLVKTSVPEDTSEYLDDEVLVDELEE